VNSRNMKSNKERISFQQDISIQGIIYSKECGKGGALLVVKLTEYTQRGG
jgi:hypothetical protein